MIRNPLLNVFYAKTVLLINFQSPSANTSAIFLTPLSIFLFSVRTNHILAFIWRCPVKRPQFPFATGFPRPTLSSLLARDAQQSSCPQFPFTTGVPGPTIFLTVSQRCPVELLSSVPFHPKGPWTNPFLTVSQRWPVELLSSIPFLPWGPWTNPFLTVSQRCPVELLSSIPFLPWGPWTNPFLTISQRCPVELLSSIPFLPRTGSFSGFCLSLGYRIPCGLFTPGSFYPVVFANGLVLKNLAKWRDFHYSQIFSQTVTFRGFLYRLLICMSVIKHTV